MIYYNGRLIFKGEEKEGLDFEGAQNDLGNKYSEFDYDYLLAYAASGDIFQLYLIDKNMKLIPILQNLQLSLAEERLKIIQFAFNIARILAAQIQSDLSKKPINTLPIMVPVIRELGVQIIKCQSKVVKKIPLSHHNIKNLQDIMKLISSSKSAIVGCVKILVVKASKN